MLKGSQGLTRGAQGRQTGATEAAWRRLWAPWGLPGETLGPHWEAPGDNFGAKIDPKLNDFAASVFDSVLLKFFSVFWCLFVFTDRSNRAPAHLCSGATARSS